MFPVGDWQFWAASLIVIAVLLVLATPIVRRMRKRAGKRVSLTLDGKSVR